MTNCDHMFINQEGYENTNYNKVSENITDKEKIKINNTPDTCRKSILSKFKITYTTRQEQAWILDNIMLQKEEVCGNTIYSSSEASGVNHIIHRSRRLR